MTEVSQHKPAAARVRVRLSVLVGALVLALAVGAPLWVPEWEPFVEVVIGGLVLLAGWAAIGLFVALRRSVRTSESRALRLLAVVFGALVLFGTWAFAALIASVSMVDGFPFGATYERQLEFPEYGTTVYLYDSSFLDRCTTVFVRQGLLPVRKEVLSLGVAPESLDIVQHGSLLMINDRELDLVTGTLAR